MLDWGHKKLQNEIQCIAFCCSVCHSSLSVKPTSAIGRNASFKSSREIKRLERFPYNIVIKNQCMPCFIHGCGSKPGPLIPGRLTMSSSPFCLFSVVNSGSLVWGHSHILHSLTFVFLGSSICFMIFTPLQLKCSLLLKYLSFLLRLCQPCDVNSPQRLPEQLLFLETSESIQVACQLDMVHWRKHSEV